MQKFLIAVVFSFFILILVSSCQKQLPNGGKPFYIIIDSAKINITNPAVQGSSSSKIEQVWVEIGSTNLGVYALPIKFPVLSEKGTYKFLIQAGIKNKGISAQRQIYPMLQGVYEDVTFDESTNTYKINPVFKYQDNCQFALNETFEFSNNFDANMNVVNDTNKFEGLNSGIMELAPLSGKTTKTTNVAIPIGSVAYLELNYKTDKPFAIGLLSNDGSNTSDIQLVVVDTKSYWNKMYIDITPEITSLNSGSYQFYLKSYNDDSTSTKNVFIDNFKVIYL